MPQITSATYNLGKPRQSSRIHSFDKANSIVQREPVINIVKTELEKCKETRTKLQLEIEQLSQEQNNNKEEIQFLNDTIELKITQIQYLINQNNINNERIQELEEQINNIHDCEQIKLELENQIYKLNNDIDLIIAQKQDLIGQIDVNNEIIQKLEEDIANININDEQTRLELENQINTLNANNELMLTQIHDLITQNNINNETIQNLEEQIASINITNQLIQELQNQISILNNEIELKTTQIQDLINENNVNNETIQTLEQQIVNIKISNNLKLVILYSTSTYENDALSYINFIQNETGISLYTIVFYDGSQNINLINAIEEQYILGFRFFASPTIGSYSLYNYCIPFFKNHVDALLLSSYSTQYFEKGVLPFNIIRSAVNDKNMIDYIVKTLLYKLNTLTETNLISYSVPIINNDIALNSKPIFEKVVYIYTETDEQENYDSYSAGYGEQLKTAIDLQNNKITLKIFKISDNSFILPQEVIDLLKENPVSGINFNSNLKIMFIINSNSPEKILRLFNEEYMYDNYFIFGDPFTSQHYTSLFKFNYAVMPVGNYSFEGYKICENFQNGNYLSPFLYSMTDIIFKMLPYYSNHFFQNKNLMPNESMLLFINNLKQSNLIIDDNYWYEQKIITYYINTQTNDQTNAQYNDIIFFNFIFSNQISNNNKYITTSGSFNTENNIILVIYNDVSNINSITLSEFNWNSRDTIVNDLLSNEPTYMLFDDYNTLLDWKTLLDKSVGGNRLNDLIGGNQKHTPLFFELWRSHDPHFKSINVDLIYDLYMDYNVDKIYNINKTFTINRECFKEAGINDIIPDDNLLNIESDEININFNTDLISNYSVSDYVILQYFKGTRYKKSFKGLTSDYLAPIIINIKINPILIYTKYKINDFVISSQIIGKVISVSNNYQEIMVQPYLTIFEESDEYFVKIDTSLQPISCNQTNTKLYSDVSPIKLIDYTDWSVFKKKMFIRSIFMNIIISDDSTQTNAISYTDFGGDTSNTILQPIKDNLSLTFSSYDNWITWKNLVSNSINDLHTKIFWEMYRSNKFDFLEKTIDINLIMYNSDSQIYQINENVEIERKIYSNFNTYESSETIILPVSFKTSDILPVDIINKPIIYVEYFTGNEYKSSFNGITESYFTPVLIHINIIPTIIYYKYEIDDYVVYQKQLGRVLSVSNNYTIIEIQLYTVITDNNNIYIKSTNYIYNVSQNDITLFTSFDLLKEIDNNYLPLLEKKTKQLKTTDINNIYNISGSNNFNSGINVTLSSLNKIIFKDSYNLDSNTIDFFYNYYDNKIVETFDNNFFITFENISIFNNWEDKLNAEILNGNKHTYLFFEVWRSQNDSITPIYLDIDYKLVMNSSTSNNYNINKTINFSRNIFDFNFNVISSENDNIQVNFYTEKILPSDVLNNPIIYVGYFKGNKYINYNGIPDYYSPVIITIHILPKVISDGIAIDEFVIFNKNIYKIINIENNYDKISLQQYLINETQLNTIFIKPLPILDIADGNDIISYNNTQSLKIVDQSEWGPFNVNNTITLQNNIYNEIVNLDSTSLGNITLDEFNLNKRNIKEFKNNLNIIFQNEDVFNNFKKTVNSSITFDKLNHTPLFFEIWRSHNTLLIPLIIEINYNLLMKDLPLKYLIETDIPFIRNIYNIIGSNADSYVFQENDVLKISINTPQITPNDILNAPLFYVNYFKGHTYLNSYNNIDDGVYNSMLIIKINIIPQYVDTTQEITIAPTDPTTIVAPTIKTGTFIYSFDNTNLATFDLTKLPIINSNTSFTVLNSYVETISNITEVTISFEYIRMLGEDGLTFKNVNSYYGSNTVTILRFGGISLSNAGYQFYNLSNLIINQPYEQDIPEIPSKTSFFKIFSNCANFNSNVNNWNTSNVTNMFNAFYNAVSFNKPLNNWNTSNVTNMEGMFMNASMFNQDISKWNVLKVTSMYKMFYSATMFDNNNKLMKWKCNDNLLALKFADNSKLYENSGSYNINPGNAIRDDGLSSIQTPIYKLAFSQTLKGQFIYSFDNTNLETFDLTKLPIINSVSFVVLDTNIENVLNTSTITISFEYRSIVGDDGLTFKNVNSYYGVNNVTIIKFGGVPLSKSGQQFSKLANLIITATDSPLILSNTSFTETFGECTNFNSNVNNWDTTNVTNMSSTFYLATNFNMPLNNWNTINVTTMGGMFWQAIKFNQDISSWNVSNVTDMTYMFNLASEFNNGRNPLYWNCNVNLTASGFGRGTKLYGKNGAYNINPGNAVRTNGISSIETPVYTLNYTPTITTGQFIYTFNFRNLGAFDITKIPILDTSSFIILNSIVETISTYVMKVTISFKYRTILGDDGLSFANISYYYANSINVTILQFDGIALSNTGNQFTNLVNLVITASDTPSILKNTSFDEIFKYCTNFNSNISNWNVTNVINMRSMFHSANLFNQDISNWDVSNVTNLSYAFGGAISFNQDIGNWDVSNVTDMGGTFSDTYVFNQDISRWNTSNVIQMPWTFNRAREFNQDISNWIVSNVTNMYWMFNGAWNFNQDLSKWNILKVTNMDYMFYDAKLFNNKRIPMRWNCNISLNAEGFGDGSSLYGEQGVYNKNPGTAVRSNQLTSIQTPTYKLPSDTLSAPIIQGTFIYSFDNRNLEDFSLDKLPIINSNSFVSLNTTIEIISAITTKVTVTFQYKFMLGNDGFSFKNVKIYYGSNNVTILQFGGIPFSRFGFQFSNLPNLVINAPDIPTFLPNTSLLEMFSNCTNFNSNINGWDMSNVTTMQSMFLSCSNFNKDISSWNVLGVTNMSGMFQAAAKFNQNINSWNVSNVTNMRGMFATPSFNQNISSWNVSSVTSMAFMFYFNTAFNQNISSWDVSNVTDMSSMFQSAIKFNQDISSWNVLNVTNMFQMFYNAESFNNLGVKMNWTCNENLISGNFGAGSNLYANNSYPGNAVRNDGITPI